MTADSQEELSELGHLFRRAREQKGYSVGEVAERLKLTPHQIEALEGGRHDLLPEAIYVRGFMRSYARFLGLDDETVSPFIASLFGAQQAAKIETASNTATTATDLKYHERKVSKPFPSWILMLIGAIALVGVVYWWQGKSAQHNTEQSQAQSAMVSSQVNSAAASSASGNVAVVALPASGVNAASAASAIGSASAPAAAGELGIHVHYRSMLSITDSTGKSLISSIVPGNSDHKFSGAPPYAVRIGYSDGSTLTYQGQPIDLASGQREGHTLSIKVPQ